ncbi:hypothetical protein ACOME3_001447 [Neoechinorhynchus agilis]
MSTVRQAAISCVRIARTTMITNGTGFFDRNYCFYGYEIITGAVSVFGSIILIGIVFAYFIRIAAIPRINNNNIDDNK